MGGLTKFRRSSDSSPSRKSLTHTAKVMERRVEIYQKSDLETNKPHIEQTRRENHRAERQGASRATRGASRQLNRCVWAPNALLEAMGL